MGEKVLFGVYSYPKSFLDSAFGQNREHIFKWLHSLNLNAFLLDWTYGTPMSDDRAKKYRKLAKQYNIDLSLKAPKDINFITLNQKVQKHSLSQLQKACRLASVLGCQNIVISLGDSNVQEESSVIKKRVVDLLMPLLKKYSKINFHIEPAMRRREYGSLEELIDLSKDIPNLYPSFNLMRLHAWNGCNLIYPDRIVKLLKQIEDGLGRDKLNHLFVQICPVSYEHGHFVPKTFGEVKLGQLSFFDSNFEYFPKASDYIKAIRKMKITPITISNTYQTEEIGAMRLRDSYFYQKLKEEH